MKATLHLKTAMIAWVRGPIRCRALARVFLTPTHISMKTKIRSQSGFLASRGLIALLFCVAASSVTTAIPTTSGLDFFSAATPAKVSHRTLTFEERVAYQRAIEDVYWRHRIWPNTNGGPKPPLDAVMSQAQLEKKVTDYLRNSQALEDYWQRPITADQLQAEMERVATHTKQPEVLRELFAALGNDPFVIAECLARPVLAERLLTNWYAYDETIHGQLKQRAAAELQAHNSVEQMKQLGGTYSEIWFIKSDSGDISQQRDARSLRLNSREWDETLQKLAATFRRAGSYLTNGRNGPLGRLPLPARSTYATVDYETIPLKEISALQEDKRRYYATTVIERTSDQLKVGTVSWLKEPLDSWLARGENEVANIMTIPSGNYQLPAISGGAGGCIDDSWTGIAANDPYPRTDHTAVWTGSEMIVWGGNSGTYLNAGERYNPSTDSWTATSMVNTPDARGNHTAVWTGTEMVVWGGADTYDLLNTGGRYNPSTDSWTPASTINAPSARLYHTAVWTGSEMIVWGGWDNISDLNTGGRYNPSTDKWTFTSTTNAPDSRWSHTAIWADSEMIVWGGAVGGGSLNTGGRYNPVTDSWTPTSMTNVPAERVFHTAVWTGTEMIVWGGTGAGGRYRAGGRYNPSTDSWIATSTTNAPAAREMHTAVWTGSEMIVWGGFLGLNTGGRYNPSTDSWIATGTTSAPDGRWFHTAVWADSEMIVWGGVGDAGTLNTGGRYNPISDNWIATTATTNNAPSARVGHTSVWSGSEMIVWGGSGNAGPVNTGGKYDPITDSWTATKTTNAPTVRERHTAVWTGSEMIVWGGGVGLNTGGKYNPGTDSWTVTSTINAPSARFYHRAVWTGSEMIVWGGTNDRTGGRYNPSTDSWTPTSTTNADATIPGVQAVGTTPAEGTTPTPTLGHPPAPTTLPLPDWVTRQYGPTVK
jgi:N-acetylneuraminic acid mutarotase